MRILTKCNFNYLILEI